MMERHPTASYRLVADEEGSRYRFYCELSGIVLCTTAPVRATAPDEGVRLAWEREGRRHFNLCPRCGRWASDVMYNADVLQCVDCAPWEDVPAFCRKCGLSAGHRGPVCPGCGAQLRYGEVNYG